MTQGELAHAIGYLLRNERHLAENPLIKAIAAIRNRIAPPHQPNTPAKSRANVAHHYDIGNDLYRSFLDEGMNYSCAFFEHADQDLRGAQLNKLRTTIRRLDVAPDMSVLDIGSGWGELTRMIARDSDADQVTGITLATEQYNLARERAGDEFGNRLRYCLEDYRDHATANPERYDRIVSIGMFEHVGTEQFQTDFQAVRRMLKAGGVALIHSIIRPTSGPTSPWIDKYIFPGGFIPRLSDLVNSGLEAGLSLAHKPFHHDHTNYATTLRHWRKRFNQAYPTLDHSHYDERFRRMWNFYLAGSEASFDANGFSVAQVLFRKNS
ncbi:MAG: cyclopropane-fatty-acyl-phospholipid synthase family protein [Alphaproteobacteria bacterium]|nr:cyclopropane-fatty-acyl-phospholipid synthase family protein [Alphaproteobacteria bacterium]